MDDKLQKIQFLIDNRQWLTLRDELSELEPFEISEIIEELDGDEGIIVFRLLSRETSKETFQHLPFENQETVISAFAKNVSRLSNLLNDLEPDDRTAFLEEMPGEFTQKLIQFLTPDERSVAVRLLGYPEDSIGRLMTPEYIAVKSDLTVSQTLEHIRIYGERSETLSVIYVVDQRWKLLDDLNIKQILLADPRQKINDLCDGKVIFLNALDDQEKAVQVFQDCDRSALPVTDSEGLLLGIVTFDDVMDVAEEETTEDFHKFGAFQEAVLNPLKAKVTYLYSRRIMWLCILVFVNVFSGSAIAGFEEVISSAIALVFFLPLLIDSGGNAGSQSATLVIRSFATGDIESKDWMKLALRELTVSLLLGVSMAAAVTLITVFRAPEITVVVAIAMVCTVVTGSMVGLLLPFVLIRLKFDPATASAPLVTSIADITGVLIYFSIASWFLGI